MIHSRHLLIASFLAAAVTASLFACKPDASERAVESQKWLEQFYTRYQIRGGWGFFGAEAKDKSVIVTVNVPAQQAEDLKAREPGEQARIIRMFACPPGTEEIWSKLEYEGDVIIQARSGGNVFSNVPCRNTLGGSAQ